MSFVLRIVGGPNKGAEIALPEGVAVTLGKSDACDVVLADATLPDESLTLAAAPDGVTLDGAALEPFAVVERGATAFAVGPADKAWDELKWPERVVESPAPSQNEEEAPGKEDESARAAAEPKGSEDESARRDAYPPGEACPRSGCPSRGEAQSAETGKKRQGCLGCLLWTVLLLVVLGALGWFFRHEAQPYVEKARPYVERAKPYAERMKAYAGRMLSKFSSRSEESCEPGDSSQPGDSISPLQEIVQRYNLAQTDRTGRTVLTGDFATRAERLVATAEAYAACPGIELDFCDDESLTTAATDTLALVGEQELRVVAATNRVLVLSGKVADLRRTLDALAADLPKLRDVDLSETAVSRSGAGILAGVQEKQEVNSSSGSPAPLQKKGDVRPSLPVCGILTTPYPCLVLKSGARVLEGAPLGTWTVARIEADSVTLTNAERSVTWRP